MVSGNMGNWKLQEEAGMWVDQETGEAIPAPWRYMEPGSVYYSPKQVKRNRKYWEMTKNRLEQAENNQFMKYIRTEQEKILGPFIYAKATEGTFCDLSPDTLARAAYLATYLKFGTDELWVSNRSKMKKSDLPRVMNFSQSTVNDFWRDVRGKIFLRGDDGFLHTTGISFIVGELNAAPSIEYQKLYKKVLRELYHKIPLKQHKKLGYVLKMLPFMNFEYNILCYNPTETVKDNIVPMTVADFCDKIDFDKTHADKLAREYGKIRFTVDQSEEVFCEFLYNGSSIGDANIAINPRLVYKGSNFWKVEALSISFAAASKSTH